MDIFLFKYNNYYNRIIKRYDTIYEYRSAKDGKMLQMLRGINFNPNDGVSTELILNYNVDYNNGEMPDYLLVVEDNIIVSRWFVIECARTRSLQYKFSLYRDLIAEWYTDVMSAPMFIEKATVGLNDPAIFNNEDMRFNQIKTSEKLIKDKSGCGWYVAYIAKNLKNTEISVNVPPEKIDESYSTLSDYPFSQYIENPLLGEGMELTFKMYYQSPTFQEGYQIGWDLNLNPKTPVVNATKQLQDGLCGQPAGGSINGYEWKFPNTASNVAGSVNRALKEVQIPWYEGSQAQINPDFSLAQIRNIRAEQDKVYQIGDKYYKVNISVSQSDMEESVVGPASAYGLNFKRLAEQAGVFNDTVYGFIGAIEYWRYLYSIELLEVPTATVAFTIPENRNKTVDAPYDLIAIPRSNIQIGTVDVVNARVNQKFTFELVNSLITALGDNLYDIQLLPFAPLEDKHIYKPNNDIDDSMILTDSFPENQGMFYQIAGENLINAIIIYPSYSQFTKTVEENISAPTSAIEFKVSNECDKYRLVSPNYNGQFEFSVTKNNGVSAWNLSYAYKPFNPYIRVSPQFGRLYGKDFGDARGLVCGGDFSISQVRDAWVNYEIQNKNYQVMFNRQIENMEVNNSVQRTLDIVGAVTGTMSGALLGGITGSEIFGVQAGAIAGAVGGAVVSAAGGAADVYLKEKLRKEALDYTKDQFGYQLQNIQALPYSLTKVGAFNPDNKIFPFLEYFTCTDIEKQALRDKITYNGMTIMRIGTMLEFKQPERTYIKGKLIRLETISDDYHILNMISKELNEGVYV